MTKKCFACILTAKDQMREILKLSDNPANIGRIKIIASRFLADFGDVDPDWRPGGQAKPAKPVNAKPATSTPAAKNPPENIKTATPDMSKKLSSIPAVNGFSADPRAADPLF